jgi:hypothetical protein
LTWIIAITTATAATTLPIIIDQKSVRPRRIGPPRPSCPSLGNLASFPGERASGRCPAARLRIIRIPGQCARSRITKVRQRSLWACVRLGDAECPSRNMSSCRSIWLTVSPSAGRGWRRTAPGPSAQGRLRAAPLTFAACAPPPRCRRTSREPAAAGVLWSWTDTGSLRASRLSLRLGPPRAALLVPVSCPMGR